MSRVLKIEIKWIYRNEKRVNTVSDFSDKFIWILSNVGFKYDGRDIDDKHSEKFIQ